MAASKFKFKAKSGWNPPGGQLAPARSRVATSFFSNADLGEALNRGDPRAAFSGGANAKNEYWHLTQGKDGKRRYYVTVRERNGEVHRYRRSREDFDYFLRLYRGKRGNFVGIRISAG
jgi:hypothetical protein